MKMLLKKREKYYNQFIIKLSAESTQDAHSGKKTTFDFESTVTLGYGRFCLIKTCLSPSRKPLL